MSAAGPVADSPGSCDLADMKRWLAIMAIAAFSAGCAGRPAGIGTPNLASGAGSAAPTDEEVRNAYGAFRYRLACPDIENCDNILWRQQPWVADVSQAECVPARRPGELRCAFLSHQRAGFTENVTFCAGLLRRERGEWHMLSVIGPCYGLPVGAPR